MSIIALTLNSVLFYELDLLGIECTNDPKGFGK